MKRKNDRRGHYTQLRRKLTLQFLGCLGTSVLAVWLFYRLAWKGRGGQLFIDMMQNVFGVDEYTALHTYQWLFRNHMDVIWLGSMAVIFLILLYVVLNWFTRYFDTINQGINALLNEDAAIHLPPEMLETERKLNMVKETLKRRSLEAELAEQRKNDLVMYLAHDIRTPMTSVIGYLSLLDEAPDMPPEQRAKFTHITLAKAMRLEKMMDEFFEITRYNLQQITIQKEPIDLYYMLVQLADELMPALEAKGNTVRLNADENLTVHGDPDKLARVFNNVLKNAAAYSYPDTEITITAEEKAGAVTIRFTNHGRTIPPEKLSVIFEKFYRLDEARTSGTGGAGLGLAIAKEIVTLHGGTITAESADGMVAFTVSLPVQSVQ